MTDDLDFEESLDRYFEIEAAELLQTIEQTLHELVEEKTVERVHTLMRAAHTIKGGAANCGYKTIETIAHHLEDVFQALYPEELEIDPELGNLLVQGYDCLYDPLSALLAGIAYDEVATLERTADLFARLQEHLGDFFGRETPLPSAADLGFDVVGSIFTDSIPQDFEDLEAAIASQNADKVKDSLASLSEFLLELGVSYSLPGIEAIAQATKVAIDRQPLRVLDIAPIALANFQAAQIAIITGDRTVGGEVSPELAAWSNADATVTTAKSSEPESAADWLAMAIEEHPAKAAVANPDNSADWLSMMAEESSTDIPDRTSDDAEDWLSMVEATPDNDNADQLPTISQTPAPDNAADAEDWLSMVESTPEVEITSESSDTVGDAEEWLSMVEDTAAATTGESSDTVADAEDWLSMVEDAPVVNSADTPPANVDLDSDIIDVSMFFDADPIEPQTGATIDEREYVIPNPPSNGVSDFILPPQTGIDRILQSIAIPEPDADAAEPELAPPPTAKAADSKDASASIRVATVQLERLSHTIGELTIDDNQQSLQAEQIYRLTQAIVDKYRRCEQKLRQVSDWSDRNALLNDRAKSNERKERRQGKKKSKKLAEAQAQFDSLELDVYSELSIPIQSLTDEIAELGMLVNNLAEMAQKSRLAASKRKQLLRDAQSELFEARMVEIAGVFNRFPRLLQQMIASHRKPACLELIGTEVSIDKTISEKLYDPLLHLVRNAYDHGIEPPEQRAMQGKPETGTLTIRAYHQGSRTKIEVSDDGQGLNWDKIRRRAIEMGLLSEATAANASSAELSEIMFAPGFSTADKVNDLSGRGIGLDVVRDRLGALQGTIEVRSVPGKGTTFIMQFPLNLTTTRLMICESQGFVHALRSESIAQVLLPAQDKITTQSLNSGSVSKFLNWGEGAQKQSIPIYSVRDLLDYRCPISSERQEAIDLFPVQSKNATNALLLLEINEQKICLEVNRILVEQELVVKSLGLNFGLASYIQGYSVLGDGSLTLAIDPIELLAPVRKSERVATAAVAPAPGIQAALPPASNDSPISGELTSSVEEPPSNSRPSTQLSKQLQVLVIDDSLVQRQSLARSLTKAGCQVIQASHGREGIVRLQEHPRIRLIVCDIEMPQMNGFEFLSYCRQDAKLSQIPIVMLTTRSGQKHRQLAKNLGAKDYITKPHADRELVDIVAKWAAPNEVGV